MTSATSWFSRMPGLSFSAISWYAPSTWAQAVLSSMISSSDLTWRASSSTCWASWTVMPSAWSAASMGGSTMSTPMGMSATPSATRIALISLAAPVNRPGAGGDRAAQADHAAADVLRRQPGAVQPVVLGGAAEVPQVRLAAPREQREAGHLVARPLADVGARDVADVGEVEDQDRAQLRIGQRALGPGQAVAPEAVHVDPLLPVDRLDARATRTGGSPGRGRATAQEPRWRTSWGGMTGTDRDAGRRVMRPTVDGRSGADAAGGARGGATRGGCCGCGTRSPPRPAR